MDRIGHGNRSAHKYIFTGQKGYGTGCGRKPLSDGFVNGFRIMGHSAKKHSVRGEFRRPQLGMFFYKKTVVIYGHFKKISKFFIPIRHDGTSKDYQIHRNFQRPVKNMIPYPYPELVSVQVNLGLAVQRISDKDNTRFASLLVTVFLLARCPDIPV